MKSTLFAAVFAAAVSLAMTAAAAAAERSSAASAHVRVDQSTLTQPDDVDALHRRIVRAAQRVCAAPSMAGLLQRNRCVRRAVDRAVAQAALAPLSVLHATRESRQRYSASRAALTDDEARLVAEAVGGGTSGSAGTIAQPEEPAPPRS
jgi:UrcA family protein